MKLPKPPAGLKASVKFDFAMDGKQTNFLVTLTDPDSGLQWTGVDATSLYDAFEGAIIYWERYNATRSKDLS